MSLNREAGARGVSSRGFGFGAGVVVALVVMIAAAAGLEGAIRAYGLYLQKLPIEAPGGRQVSAIPVETANWVRIGGDRIESAEVLEELGTTNYLTRTYAEKNPSTPGQPRTIELHLAYYTGMIDTVPHVPERCFVGGGMSIGEGSRRVPIELDESGWVEDTSLPEGVEGPVMLARLPNLWSDKPGARVRLPGDPRSLEMLVTGFNLPGNRKLYSGYFFIANGGTVASANDVRTLAFKLTDDYAYYYKVQFTSANVADAQELAELAGLLLDDLYGEIARCAPDWIEVRAGRYPPQDVGRGS